MRASVFFSVWVMCSRVVLVVELLCRVIRGEIDDDDVGNTN